MIHLGIMKGITEDGKVRVEIPEVAVGYYCVVKVNPEDNFQVGDQLALSKISGSADEFYALGKIDSTFGTTYSAIANGVNLNSLTSDGSYVVFTNATAATLVNAPEAKAGILRVHRAETATWLIQTYAVYSPGSGTGNFYSRGYDGTTWSVWRRVITSVDTFGPSGVFGTLDTALTTLDSRLDALEPRMTAAEGTIVSHTSTIGSHTTSIGTLGTRATALEAEDVALDTRLDTIEALHAATKKWSVNLPSNWDTSNTVFSYADITGLTVTVPTVTGGQYAIWLIINVHSLNSANKTFIASMNLNGTIQDEQINFRTPVDATITTTNNKVTLAQMYFYDSATTGNKVFKAQGYQDVASGGALNQNYRVNAPHSHIKVIRIH